LKKKGGNSPQRSFFNRESLVTANNTVITEKIKNKKSEKKIKSFTGLPHNTWEGYGVICQKIFFILL